MLSFCAAMLPIGEDGKVRSARTGTVHWDPDVSAQLAGTFGDYIQATSSAAAMSIHIVDGMSMYRQPYCFELPQVILDIVAADPFAAISEGYRRYVRTVLLPGVHAVAELLKAHAAVIEWPPMEWLAEQFPETLWSTRPNSSFGEQWAGYVVSWDRVMAEWEAEKFTALHPAGSMPFGGLVHTIDWSRKRGEAKQQELIGMTAEAEVDIAILASYGVSATTAKAAQPTPTTFQTEDT